MIVRTGRDDVTKHLCKCHPKLLESGKNVLALKQDRFNQYDVVASQLVQ